MNRAISGALLLLGLYGCAHSNDFAVNSESAFKCGDGFASIYFQEGSRYLSPISSRSLWWPATSALQCSVTLVKVTGLPMPGTDTLAAQRAAVLVSVMKGYGLPEPAFELGDEDDQSRPQIEIRATAKPEG